MASRMLVSVMIIVIGLLSSAPVWGQDSQVVAATLTPTVEGDVKHEWFIDFTSDESYQYALKMIGVTQRFQYTDLLLEGMDLEVVPIEIKDLAFLQTLSFASTQITTLPREIGYLTDLRELYVWSTNLSGLPPEIWTLTHLEKLIISDTNINSLSPRIANLTSLQELNLCDTQLTSLPSEISQLKQLQTLYLCQTFLTRLPPEIAQLTQLQFLDISSTQITSLPLEMGHLTNLTNLNITYTPLTFPPPEIVRQGTPAILAYLRDYEAMLMHQTIAGLAAGVGGIVSVMLLFRWRQQRGLQEKKKKRAA